MGDVKHDGSHNSEVRTERRGTIRTLRWWSLTDMMRWRRALRLQAPRERRPTTDFERYYLRDRDGNILRRGSWTLWFDLPIIWRRILYILPQKRQGSLLDRPPGYGLLWFADFFYSKKSVEECLQPTIEDLQDEYAEALAANRPRKATWVRIRGTWSFACAAGMLTMASIGKQVVKIWKMVG